MLSSVKEDNFAALDDLWSLVETRRNFQGGFVNQWPLSKKYLSDLKLLYGPLDVHLVKTNIDDAEFTVYNTNVFSDFRKYILEYTIFTNLRHSITAGDLPVAIDGGGVEAVKLRIPPVDLQPGEEMFVLFELETRGNNSRVIDEVVIPLSGNSQPKHLFVNRGTLDVESCNVDSNALMLQFADRQDWVPEVVASSRRAEDSGIVCIDAMIQYKSSGRHMCDVRETYTFFGTGDVVVDYIVSPTDDFRGNLTPQVMLSLPQGEADSLTWFGLLRETNFLSRGMGYPGIYTEMMEKLNGTTLQQVRWCARNNQYVALIGTLFTMNISGNRLTLTPASNSKTFRLHLKKFSQDQNPQDFYGTEMPVVKSNILDSPIIKSSEARFTQPMMVSITSPSEGVIRYTLDGSEPTENSMLYEGPITLTSTTVVKARAYGSKGNPSFTSTRKFNYDYIVRTTFSQKPNTPFNLGADTLLFDGERSTIDDLQQGWLGFSGRGVTTTVELSKPIDIDAVTLRYAHFPEMWAFVPQQVIILLSSDGQLFTDTVNVSLPFDPTLEENNNPQVVELRVPVKKDSVGFLKIKAQSIGSVPAWHRAKGLNPWLLMDEIEVSESTSSKEQESEQ